MDILSQVNNGLLQTRRDVLDEIVKKFSGTTLPSNTNSAPSSTSSSGAPSSTASSGAPSSTPSSGAPSSFTVPQERSSEREVSPPRPPHSPPLFSADSSPKASGAFLETLDLPEGLDSDHALLKDGTSSSLSTLLGLPKPPLLEANSEITILLSLLKMMKASDGTSQEEDRLLTTALVANPQKSTSPSSSSGSNRPASAMAQAFSEDLPISSSEEETSTHLLSLEPSLTPPVSPLTTSHGLHVDLKFSPFAEEDSAPLHLDETSSSKNEPSKSSASPSSSASSSSENGVRALYTEFKDPFLSSSSSSSSEEAQRAETKQIDSAVISHTLLARHKEEDLLAAQEAQGRHFLPLNTLVQDPAFLRNTLGPQGNILNFMDSFILNAHFLPGWPPPFPNDQSFEALLDSLEADEKALFEALLRKAGIEGNPPSAVIVPGGISEEEWEKFQKALRQRKRWKFLIFLASCIKTLALAFSAMREELVRLRDESEAALEGGGIWAQDPIVAGRRHLHI